MFKLALSYYLQSTGVGKEFVDLPLLGVCACFIGLCYALWPQSSMWDYLWSSAAPPFLGVFCRRVGLVGGLLSDLHFLDTREGLAGADSLGMISGGRAWYRVPKSPREGREVTGESSENLKRTISSCRTCVINGQFMRGTWSFMPSVKVVTVHGGVVTVCAGGVTVRAGGVTVCAGGVTVHASGVTVRAGGVTVRAGGVTVLAGGVTICASGVTFRASGRNGSCFCASSSPPLFLRETGGGSLRFEIEEFRAEGAIPDFLHRVLTKLRNPIWETSNFILDRLGARARLFATSFTATMQSVVSRNSRARDLLVCCRAGLERSGVEVEVPLGARYGNAGERLAWGSPRGTGETMGVRGNSGETRGVRGETGETKGVCEDSDETRGVRRD
ncbi:hypothetical protein ACLB2K_062811 [Fragaria x ananassa]